MTLTQLIVNSLRFGRPLISVFGGHNRTLTCRLSSVSSQTTAQRPTETRSPQPTVSSLSVEWSVDGLHGLTDDQIELRASVRNFMDKEITEDVVQLMDRDSHWSQFRQFWRRLGEMGFLGPTAPVEYGGLGLGYFEHCIICEEISRRCGAMGMSYSAHSNLCVNQIVLNGSDEQKQRFLPKLIDGSFVGALAMSEVGSGSDVTSMRTTAERCGDYYVLNGSKFWISNGSEADVLFVYAKTSERGITPFIVEKGMPRFSVGQIIDKLGMRGSPTSELLFDNCKVPVTNMIGRPDNGVYVLMSGLDYERLVLSGVPLGIMQASVELAFDYAHQRRQFGREIGTFQLIQGKMADMYTRLSSSRAYLYNTARAVDKYKNQFGSSATLKDSSPLTKDCAGVALQISETATQLALDAIQILGGNGYTNDYSAGRLLRDAKVCEIGAGTSEMRRWLIGRQLNKEYLS